VSLEVRDELRLTENAEKALLRYLAENGESRLAISAIVSIDDFENTLHRRILAALLDFPGRAIGTLVTPTFYALHERGDRDAFEYFLTLGLSEPLLGFAEALQLAAYIVLLSAYRHEAEIECCPERDASGESPW
jgi:hypothetical protein